jgi:hypothetical protein
MIGKYKGGEGSDMGTYYTVMKPGDQGVMYGEGWGVVTTKDGNGLATWTDQGIGKFTSLGTLSFRGSLFFSAPSASGGKLASLNNVIGVFEYE